ncbi:PREDICTED: UDP-glycosyltransferase 83A1-like [Nelumbo nucifera]|uniref:UDP-glycosyltransferase 83A1-like n=2 Tax=Nelumbo nucifera TaxID=4432 RepID=A0A1U8BBE8_NELNU|nr:PREDICTED: UDP-glycosyltransferase 83A1-like [Nelumbo nucifera]DAD37655.1 TPA_asm: hypothetical protein HUJ06_008296 [Nelumbo nucifera]
MAKKAHVVVIPASVQGHVTPLMELSQSLAIRGIRVTFVIEESVKERVMAAFPNKGNMHSLIRLASIPDGAKFGDDTKEIDAARKVMPGYLENLIRKINEESDNNNKINCFIASAALKWAMEVSEKMGIKRAAFSTTSVGVLALLLHIPKLIQAGIINESGTALKNEMIQLSPNAPAISTADLLWNCTEDPTMQSIIFKEALDTKSVTKLCDWILCNSFYELEPWFCDLIPNSLPVGPLLSNVIPGGTIGSLWQEDSTCISWLDQQPARSIIYVAFGSFATFSQRQFDELAAGLQLASGPFLWVIRPDFMNGSNRNRDEFRDGVAHCGKIVSWAPQQKVLGHPSVACFISHCGWNSIMDGLSKGVPFLCWPQFADQFFNKHLICDVWRVGLDLEVDENNLVSRDEIKCKVKKLLGDDRIKAKASELKEMSWKAGNQGGTSFSNLEDFC